MLPLRQYFRKAVNAPLLYATLGIALAAGATTLGFQTMNAATPEYQAHEKYAHKQTMTADETRLALDHAQRTGASMALMALAVGAGWAWERKRAQRALTPEFQQKQSAASLQAKVTEVEALDAAIHEGTSRKLRIKPIKLKPEAR